MATGTVKWFNAEKGYGFIQPDEGGKDVFVHVSAVEQAGLRYLQEGQKINYEVVPDRSNRQDSRHKPQRGVITNRGQGCTGRGLGFEQKPDASPGVTAGAFFAFSVFSDLRVWT